MTVPNKTYSLDDNDLSKKMWGKYLQNERKYDLFGAQGKMALLQEVLNDSGIVLESGMDVQQIINRIFPRTFFCERKRMITERHGNAVLRHFHRLYEVYANQGLSTDIVEYICLSETAEKFCLPASDVKNAARRI